MLCASRWGQRDGELIAVVGGREKKKSDKTRTVKITYVYLPDFKQDFCFFVRVPPPQNNFHLFAVLSRIAIDVAVSRLFRGSRIAFL